MPTLLAASSAPMPLPKTQAHVVTKPPTAPADPLLGQLIAERFRIEERLGAGGMGTVYRAEQLAVGRAVVLKFLHARLSRDADLSERFQREALAVSQLSSPNTIVLYDFGTAEDGRLYMAMEFLEGRTLADLVAAAGPLPPLRAIALTLQILGSLTEAHKKGIVHRDLKPENIMLVNRAGTSDFVKVLDFGIAKIVGEEEPTVSPVEAARRRAEASAAGQSAGLAPSPSGLLRGDSQLTQQGAVFGSPRYMAPEQALGGKIDARTDLYAVGMILYELLCGRPPFGGENTLKLLHDQAHTPVPPLTEAHPQLGVAQELSELVARCLQKDPDERPVSALALADELRGVTQVVVRQHQAEEDALLELVGVRRRFRRGPLLVGLLAVLALLVVAGLLAWRFRGRAPVEGGALAAGDRIFIGAAGKAPAWVQVPAASTPSTPSTPSTSATGRAGLGWVRGAESRADALALAEAAAAARWLDVPLRFGPAEAERHRQDLRLIWEAYRVATDRLAVEGRYWVKLGVGRSDGAIDYRYDGYVKLAGPSAVQRAALRRVLADRRFVNGSFLLGEHVRQRQCEGARRRADAVRAAIDDLPLKKERKVSMRGYLLHQLGPCKR